MSTADESGDGRREYATADPERFAETFGLGEAHRYVAKNGVATPRIAVVDAALPPTAGDDTGPEELDVVGRKVYGDPSGDNTHGTRSASVAAAEWGNDVGVDGVSSAEVLGIGVAFDGSIETDTPIASAVRWAVDNDADVITMSLSLGKNDALVSALDYAAENGVVVVASAGNTDAPVSESRRTYPQAHPDVISVGATDSYGERVSLPKDPRRYEQEVPWGSAYGETVDVSAWGVHVPAIFSDDTDDADDTPYWWEPTFHHGTSASCPVVAGVVGLMLRVNPDLSPDAVREVLTATGTDIDPDEPIGPRVHAARAVKAAAARR